MVIRIAVIITDYHVLLLFFFNILSKIKDSLKQFERAISFINAFQYAKMHLFFCLFLSPIAIAFFSGKM